jgi:two-component system chemotaxis sensor kinase CheA
VAPRAGLLQASATGARAAALPDALERSDPGARAEPPTRAALETRELLTFRVAPQRWMALPLAAVIRLEDLPARAIEQVTGRSVVQYRGAILPLLDLRGEFGGASALPAERVPVIIHRGATGAVGLIVEDILDVARGEGPLDVSGCGRGIAGSLVVGGRVTDLLDVESLLSRSRPAQA